MPDNALPQTREALHEQFAWLPLSPFYYMFQERFENETDTENGNGRNVPDSKTAKTEPDTVLASGLSTSKLTKDNVLDFSHTTWGMRCNARDNNGGLTIDG